MSEGDISAITICIGWIAWSLAMISARSKRTADALEMLAALAERGRQ